MNPAKYFVREGRSKKLAITFAYKSTMGVDLGVGDYRWKESITIRFRSGDTPSVGT